MNWFQKSAGSDLSSSDIYDIFALSLIPHDANIDSKMIDFEARFIRDKFVLTFMPLLQGQIKKYLGRDDRYDHDQLDYLNTYESADADDLANMFNSATFRSLNHRSYAPEDVYNVKWGEIASAVDRLANSSGFRDIVFNLAGQNGLLNLVHNTQTSVLDKLPGGDRILAALDECHVGDPQQILSKASSDIRDILRGIL